MAKDLEEMATKAAKRYRPTTCKRPFSSKAATST